MQPRSLPTRWYTSTRCYITSSSIGKSVHLLWDTPHKFTLLHQQFWQVSCVLHMYKFTLLHQQFWQVSCVLHTYKFTLLHQQFWQVSCVLHTCKFTLLLQQFLQVSCVLYMYKFTLLHQQFWQVSCVLHTYKSTLLHQSNPQNKNEKQKFAQFEHAPIRWGPPQTRDKTRNFTQTDIRSLNSTEDPSCLAWKHEAEPRLVFWKFIQPKILSPHKKIRRQCFVSKDRQEESQCWGKVLHKWNNMHKN